MKLSAHEWYELLTTGKSKHGRLVKSKEKQVKGYIYKYLKEHEE